MLSLFSSLSGGFTRQVLVSAVLPAVLMVLSWILLVEPHLTPKQSLLQSLTFLGDSWQLSASVVLPIAVASLLMVVNLPLLRLLEGYPLTQTWWGRWAIARHVRRHKHLIHVRDATTRLMVEDPRIVSDTDIIPDGLDTLRKIQEGAILTLAECYPELAGSILPTRFGNRLRAFEDYPRWQYGMDGVTLWPFLIAVSPPEQLGRVTDARTYCEFAVHLSLLSALCGVLSWLYAITQFFNEDAEFAWPLIAVGFGYLIATWGFYQVAIRNLEAWGVFFRRTFDLYRNTLRETLHLPHYKDLEDERKMWLWMTRQLIYGDEFQLDSPINPLKIIPRENPNLPQSPTHVRDKSGVEVAFHLTYKSAPGSLRVCLKIEAEGNTEDLEEMTLKYTPLSGYVLLEGSLKELTNQTFTVLGDDPYFIEFNASTSRKWFFELDLLKLEG